MITIDKLQLEAQDFLDIMKGFKHNKQDESLDTYYDGEDPLDGLVEETKEKKPNNVVKFDVDPDADEDDINESIEGVLKHISNSNKITLQSNFSRYNALWIGACASQGLITSVDEDGNLTDRWKLTVKGLKLINGEE